GYIQSGGPVPEMSGQCAFLIESFTEKPDQQTANRYLEAGSCYWNSGIFMMKASVWCNAIQATRNDIYQACETAVKKGTRDGDFFRLDEDTFLHCPADSIDYAVMEKLQGSDQFKCAVVPMQSRWSDVGSWSAVRELSNENGRENVIHGDVITKDSENCLVRAGQRLVTILGCRDLVVVETADAVLVADREKAQDVKDIVAQLNEQGREEPVLHRKVHRPWGSYETIDAGEQFQVKRLIVKPGKKLSLQSHNKRAEHWVVVNGTATVTRGEETFDLHKDESTYIPIGTKHRLENATQDLLEIIEVQSGEYLGEDDIIRYDDDFGRA
ncbi:MAG: mannose-1-phosphate guanylyltransferase/mannose-6-phosphate isomerase, partial [Gammaproteobacteria bacterium]|nr:mannose-1-phosphate guanylyltransferase/mannose-6-phosphate isomerase [Gammaproteobacteria bacterium]